MFTGITLFRFPLMGLTLECRLLSWANSLDLDQPAHLCRVRSSLKLLVYYWPGGDQCRSRSDGTAVAADLNLDTSHTWDKTRVVFVKGKLKRKQILLLGFLHKISSKKFFDLLYIMLVKCNYRTQLHIHVTAVIIGVSLHFARVFARGKMREFKSIQFEQALLCSR
jgi:hypothetical protein